jgi:RNA polymerase sigma factor (sigma-70 family)
MAKIFRSHHQALYRYCLAILGNRQDAEDALQDTMVKVLRALPGEKRSIALKPWLYRVAHNQSIDLLRRRREGDSLEERETPGGEELTTQVELRQRLRQLIADLEVLPERQRGALLMREAAGLNLEEIATALNTSSAVARQTLYEARLGLRQMDAGREMKCDAITKALSDGDGRVRRRRDIRAHLRDCGDCRRFAAEIDSRRDALAAISPLPAVAATALLQGLIGGGGGAAAGGAAAGTGGGLLGGAAVKSVGTATLLKSAATVAVVAAIGVGAADRGGLIHTGADDPAPRAPTEAGSTGAASAGSQDAASSADTGSSGAISVDKSSTGAGGSRAVDPARAVSRPSRRSAADTTHHRAQPAAPQSSEDGAPPGRSGAEHPHGRGHQKQAPASAAHGQETASSHQPEKASGSGGSGGPRSGPGKPTAATHPVQPTNPSKPQTATTPAPAADPTAKSPPGKAP